MPRLNAFWFQAISKPKAMLSASAIPASPSALAVRLFQLGKISLFFSLMVWKVDFDSPCSSAI
tara:strand:- start:307 stop:495 length:189 start_codon:yes stop_codon:yes gene_type:complete